MKKSSVIKRKAKPSESESNPKRQQLEGEDNLALATLSAREAKEKEEKEKAEVNPEEISAHEAAEREACFPTPESYKDWKEKTAVYYARLIWDSER